MRLFRPRRDQVGARPGTLAVPEDSPPPRIRYIDYGKDELIEGDITDTEELRPILDRPTVTWVDVQGLGDQKVLFSIAKVFSLHELLLEDVANVPQRPKVDEYEGHVLFVTRMVELGSELELKREQVSVVLGKNYVLTFQERYGDILDPVRQRLRIGKGPIRKSGPDYLAYAILDTIIDGYFPAIEELGSELEQLEDDVLLHPVPATLKRVNHVKNLLLILRRFLWPNRDALNKLARDPHAFVKSQTRLYFRDTHDNCLQAVELVEACRDLASGLMNTYLSAAGNRMNEIMKVLTIMASIFIPLTFMAGIYGMNFETMPELKVGWAYPALLVLMAVTALGMVLYFWKKGWIAGRRKRDRG